MESRIWYVTFGSNTIHPVTGESLGKRFVRLEGTEDEVRQEMNRRFGPTWGFIYPNADNLEPQDGLKPWQLKGAGVEKYGLKELVLTGNLAVKEVPIHRIGHFGESAWCGQGFDGLDKFTFEDARVTCVGCLAAPRPR